MIEFLELLREEIRGRVPALREVGIAFEYPPNLSMGDLSIAAAFELAKQQKRKPREIATEIAGQMQGLAFVRRVDVAGGGYINLFLDRPAFLKRMLDPRSTEVGAGPGDGKVIVEHTNINPNKAAHVGHLRNAVLGDTLVRLLRFQGQEVEAQNYIDDTGVQVADVVCAFMHVKKMSREQVAAIPDPFDYYCWDLYAEFSTRVTQDKELEGRREETLHRIEQGGNETAELAQEVATRIVKAHLATMERIGVRYDLLAWEGDIIRRRFWATCFELLKEKGAVHLALEGKNAGCWVMDLPDLPEAEKVIVRSSGVVTYVGKDIAYQMWKFGLLGMDFFYKVWARYPDGSVVWTTTADTSDEHPGFGGASSVYNVIDVRQAYLQKVVYKGLEALGYREQSGRSVHFSYEMVALTPGCARDLGYELSPEDEKRPFVEVSGRKGLGVKADDLLTALERKAYDEVAQRNPQYDDTMLHEMARSVASGALRYFMLRFGRAKVLAFDLKEALNFDGETGPYLQYAAVRARNIFAKLKERDGTTAETVRGIAADAASYAYLDEADDIWDLVLSAARMDETVAQALSSLELSHVAKYSYTLAQKFNGFYHKHPILHEADPAKKQLRILAAHYLSGTIQTALNLLGIELPERM
ncbi:MAG: arginine--tRNA ligase [Acidobacteria bacterium]|nr:arginine--tRNA ligase [Acidobacteriota bacterium]